MDKIIYVYAFICIIFLMISELFGRAKHIGRWWTFFLLIGGILPGILALIFSPSAEKEPTKGGIKFKIWGIIFLLFGFMGFAALNESNGRTAGISFAFIIFCFYLFQLSNGNIVNSDPKFYFRSIKSNGNLNNLESDKEKLQFLMNSNIIDENEYLEKRTKIDHQINNQALLNTNEYKILKSLFESNVLSKEEFENKLEKLKLEGENIINKTKKYITNIKYVKDNYSIKMGTSREFHLIMNDNSGVKIYEKKENGKWFCYDKNDTILLFPDKETCINYVQERI